ncbi:hypothetical protein B0H19DRAFT_1261085 [Mycena capillaripes]|nr:hypothetical protein B0H19DRAFT_1261085 [Mycena capillaripes]
MASHLEVFVIIGEGGGDLEEYFGQTCVGDAGSSDSRLQGKEGSVNIKVSVNVPSGHSCIPLLHAAIGILSWPPLMRIPHATLSLMNPFSEFAMSLVEYGPIDNELKHARAHERPLFVAARLLAEQCPGDAARLLKTQAVDIVCTCVAHFHRCMWVNIGDLLLEVSK